MPKRLHLCVRVFNETSRRNEFPKGVFLPLVVWLLDRFYKSCPEYATNKLTMRHAACYRTTQGKAGPMGRGDRAPRSRPSLSPGMARACPSAGKVAGNSCVSRILTKKSPKAHGLVTAIQGTKCFHIILAKYRSRGTWACDRNPRYEIFFHRILTKYRSRGPYHNVGCSTL